MKRILSALLCIVMLLSMTACGKSTARQRAEAAETTAVTPEVTSEEESQTADEAETDDWPAETTAVMSAETDGEVSDSSSDSSGSSDSSSSSANSNSLASSLRESEETATVEAEEASVDIPPAMDEVITKLTASDTSDDAGDLGVKYSGFDDTADVIACIEEYISVLEDDYGYTLLDSEKVANSYYVYYLDSSDSSLESITYREHTCQMAIEGFANDSYSFKAVYLYYSPTIVGNYRSDGGVSSSSSSSTSTSSYNSNVAEFAKKDCSICGGDGRCTVCGGDGYLWSSASGKEDRNCWRCTNHNGKCWACGGSGKQ